MTGFIRLGEHVVPRKSNWTFAGTRGSPDVNAMFEVRDGRPECVEVTIKAKPDGRGIRTADMQLFNLDALTTTVFATVALTAEKEPGGATRIEPAADPLAAVRSVYEARKVRRGSVTRAELEDVARVYREHFDRAPAKAVEMLLGYSERTAGRRIKQARKVGLLPATTQGKKAR